MNNTTNNKTKQVPAEFGALAKENFEAEYSRLISADIAEAQAHLEELPERDRRGLTLETFRHFHCGFLPDWILTKSRAEYTCGLYYKDVFTREPKHLPPPSKRIIIPTPSLNHFNAVATDRLDMESKYWKQHAGSMELFADPKALDSDLIFIVEGELDAMSIWQCSAGNFAAVAILGCANWKKTLLPILPKLRDKKLLLLFDADAAGKKSAKKLLDELLQRGCLAVTKFLRDALPKQEQNDSGWKVDANDILKYHGDAYLKNLLEKVIASAKYDFDSLAEKIAQQNILLHKQAALPAPELTSPIDEKKTTSKPDKPFSVENVDREQIKLILKDYVHAKNLNRTDWCIVGMILKRYDFSLDDWQLWSKDDSRYSTQTCATQWKDFKTAEELHGEGYTIATLIRMAKEFGYKPKRKISTPAADADPVTDSDWWTIRQEILNKLAWNYNKKEQRTTPKDWVYNYKTIFNGDPNLKGLFGRDDFRQEIVFKKRAPWHDPDVPIKDSWEDSDDSELRLYLAEYYSEFGTKQRIDDYITRVARENHFHGIKQFLEGLPDWDGTERMDTLFIKFLGADDTRYTREVTKHFLLGAIARALYPGCNFQETVVLQGPQGIGKSRLLRMLGGKDKVNPREENWHVALRDQLDDSHAVDAMRKGWIIELEEFAAVSRADTNATKGALSADDFTRRFAYDRRARTIKAHWVFCVTTNDDSPLRDQTGNRRFLPVKCRNRQLCIVEGMTPEYIRQVWAEAYRTFKEMFPTVDDFTAEALKLPDDIKQAAYAKAENITQDDGLTTEIKGFLNQKILPPYLWNLLTKEQRRDFIKDGCLKMEDAVTYFIHKRRAKGGREDIVQADVDKITGFLEGIASKGYVMVETKEFKGRRIDDFTIYGSEYRTHICAAEIFNEAFGADNRKRMNRINEVLSHLEGWQEGERFRKDPQYPDQKKVYWAPNSTNDTTAN